jgi:hypothetical protein
MTAPLQNRVQQALDELRVQRERLARAQTQLAGSATKVTSKDHLLTVTLDERGDLASLVFHGTRYRRVAPTELAAVVVETLRTARAQALERMTELFAPFFPAGMPLQDLMRGDVDLDAMFADAVRTADEPLPGEAGGNGGGNGGGGHGV